MKKTIILIAALAALVSCKSLKNEWDPVFTGEGNLPAYFIPVTVEYLKAEKGLEEFTTIADLKAMYRGQPLVISGNVWIQGKLTTSDKSGNIYNEMYIQDATGAIDVKMGRSSLYSEYKVGQTIYIFCDGLTLGAYNGQPQLGFAADNTTTNEYDTSYFTLQAIVDEHVFRGFISDPLKPKVVTENEIKASITAGFKGDLWGQLVTLKGLTYGKATNGGAPEIFALLYPNPNMAHKSGNPENRVFLSEDGNTWGVNTWSCTKTGYVNYLQAGLWDNAQVGSGATRYGSILGRPADYLQGEVRDNWGMDMYLTYKEIMIKYASANYISHYFSLGGTPIQVRTSGYAKFADEKLPEAILSQQAVVSITGIITIYNGDAQLTLIDEPSVSVVFE